MNVIILINSIGIPSFELSFYVPIHLNFCIWKTWLLELFPSPLIFRLTRTHYSRPSWGTYNSRVRVTPFVHDLNLRGLYFPRTFLLLLLFVTTYGSKKWMLTTVPHFFVSVRLSWVGFEIRTSHWLCGENSVPCFRGQLLCSNRDLTRRVPTPSLSVFLYLPSFQVSPPLFYWVSFLWIFDLNVSWPNFNPLEFYLFCRFDR